MNAEVISSGHLQLFPPSSNTRHCGSQLPFSGRASTGSIALKPRRRPGALRITARAAVYAPTQTQAETFYDMLGISETGSISDIKKAYKQLARKYHPDVSPADRTEEYTKRFIEVQEAYETLSDPQTRALYDMNLGRGLHFAFSTGRRNERMDDVEEWKLRWQSQLDELRLWSMHRDNVSSAVRGKAAASASSSWGSRMRRKRTDIYDLGFR
nr:chaperone protein dnaJ 20, chloroplastic-like [Coffea arabica]